MSATAIVFGGKRIKFTDSDLREFIAHPAVYKLADNLPKWLAVKYMFTHNLRFAGAYTKAVVAINAAIDNPTTFNVRSDRPYRR